MWICCNPATSVCIHARSHATCAYTDIDTLDARTQQKHERVHPRSARTRQRHERVFCMRVDVRVQACSLLKEVGIDLAVVDLAG